MSKIKWLRYLLASAALIVACACFALADGPVATVNGQPYNDLASAVAAASAGSSVKLVSSYSSPSSVTIPSGVLFIIPDSLTLSFTGSDRLFIDGNLKSWGSVVRTGASTNNGLVNIRGTGHADFYGTSYSTTDAGIAIRSSDSATVNIFDGSYFGTDIALNRVDSSVMNVYGGVFSSVNSSVTLGHPSFRLDPSDTIVSGGLRTRLGSVTFSSISSFVTSACQWILLFCAAIVANKLLLIFFLVIFAALGIGLIRRIID